MVSDGAYVYVVAQYYKFIQLLQKHANNDAHTAAAVTVALLKFAQLVYSYVQMMLRAKLIWHQVVLRGA